MKKLFVCASETCALDAVGASMLEIFCPVEIVLYPVITEDGLNRLKKIAKEKFVPLNIYLFCKTRYSLEGINVHEIREKIMKIWETSL